MHSLTLKVSVELSSSYAIEPGNYIAEDLNCAQLICHAGGGSMKPLEERRPVTDKQDWNGKKLLFVRAGGYGDIILLTPVLREFKRRWPDCSINVSTVPGYADVLIGLTFIDSVVPYPIPEALFRNYDGWVFFEKAIEENPRAKIIHMTDLFAEIAGLTAEPGLAANGGHPAIDDKQTSYFVSENEKIWLNEQYPRKLGKRRLALGIGTSGACRKFPSQGYTAIVRDLIGKGWEVYILGSPGEAPKAPGLPGLYNLTLSNTTFRQSAALIGGADCFLGNDSALLHIAGALKTPAVGLYGPFPHELRTKYAETTYSFQGKGECAPCFHHTNPFRGDDFPPQCPSAEQGFCQVLASIELKRIIAKIESLARKFEIKPLG